MRTRFGSAASRSTQVSTPSLGQTGGVRLKPLAFVIEYAARHVWPRVPTMVSMVLLVGVQLLAPWIIKTMVGTLADSGLGPEAWNTITRLAILASLGVLRPIALSLEPSVSPKGYF
jgi:hypothetical protein